MHLFQFQSGTVKRTRDLGQNDIQESFNSKVVRLKEEENFSERPYCLSFNSKVVRLKAFQINMRYIFLKKFQFQSGTVKSVWMRC